MSDAPSPVFLVTCATGSTGNIGGHTAAALAARARDAKRRVTIRLAARDTDKALAALQHVGGGLVTVDAVRFDLTDTATYAPALRGVEAVFLNSPDHDGIDTPERLGAFLDAAAAEGGGDPARAPYVVRLVAAGLGEVGEAVRGAAREVGNALVEGHALATRTLQERRDGPGDVPLTLVNVQAWFFSNWSTLYTDLVRSGTLAVPSADAPLPYVDPRDVGDFFAAVMLDRARYAGRDLTVTGDVTMTAHDWAAAIAAATGRPVKAAATDAVLKPVLSAQQLAPGLTMWDVMAPFHAWESRLGELGVLKNDVAGFQAVTGRAHRPVAAYCAESVPLWTAEQ